MLHVAFNLTENFNPRSLTGATTSRGQLFPHPRHFNPRSLTGATLLRCIIIGVSRISIHAPSRERHLVTVLQLLGGLFQSTLPHGSDVISLALFLIQDKFQSTLPHGSDARHHYLSGQHRYFNPRSLTGAT